MFKLIQIELKKIFHKKSIYAILSLMLLFCLLNNILFYLDYDEEGFYKEKIFDTIEDEREELVQELSKYDIHKEADISMYITLKSKIDTLDLKKQFSKNTWQYNIVDDYFYHLIYQINIYTYQLKDENILKELKKEYNIKRENLTNNHWKYFINIKIKEINTTIKKLKEENKTITSSLEKKQNQERIIELNNQLKILKYRIENNVKMEQNYLNVALEEYQENKEIVDTLKKRINKLSQAELNTYQNSLSKVKINEYILKNKQNINKENSVNYQLRTITEDYEIFLSLLILIISSTIICEEFGKGTIKLLLIKPYSRGKILLSKYFTCLLVLLISIIFLILLELCIGIPLFGRSSLNLPVVIYHFGKEKLIEYPIFYYMFIRIIARLPFFIMLLTISFTLSVLFTSTVVSITIPMMIYLFDNVIRNLGIRYHIKIIKYLININWHFENNLFGKASEISGINLKFSCMIWVIYFIVLTMLTYYNFQKKNIRNI